MRKKSKLVKMYRQLYHSSKDEYNDKGFFVMAR